MKKPRKYILLALRALKIYMLCNHILVFLQMYPLTASTIRRSAFFIVPILFINVYYNLLKSPVNSHIFEGHTNIRLGIVIKSSTILNVKPLYISYIKRPHCFKTHQKFKDFKSTIKSDVKVVYPKYLEQMESNIHNDPSRFWSFVKNRKYCNPTPFEITHKSAPPNEPHYFTVEEVLKVPLKKKNKFIQCPDGIPSFIGRTSQLFP
nr:unnamed protein product [Callosobruchus analis]